MRLEGRQGSCLSTVQGRRAGTAQVSARRLRLGRSACVRVGPTSLGAALPSGFRTRVGCRRDRRCLCRRHSQEPRSGRSHCHDQESVRSRRRLHRLSDQHAYVADAKWERGPRRKADHRPRNGIRVACEKLRGRMRSFLRMYLDMTGRRRNWSGRRMQTTAANPDQGGNRDTMYQSVLSLSGLSGDGASVSLCSRGACNISAYCAMIELGVNPSK